MTTDYTVLRSPGKLVQFSNFEGPLFLENSQPFDQGASAKTAKNLTESRDLTFLQSETKCFLPVFFS